MSFVLILFVEFWFWLKLIKKSGHSTVEQQYLTGLRAANETGVYLFNFAHLFLQL